jgi:hypothetical protein
MAIADRERSPSGRESGAMNTNLQLVGIAVCIAMTATGCMREFRSWLRDDGSTDYTYSDPSYSDPYYDPYTPETNIVVQDGILAGAMGDYSGFEAVAYEQTAYDYGYSANVRLDAGEGYWVMTSFNIEGGLNHPDLAPGAHLVFDNAARYDTYYEPSAEPELFVSVVGCSGPSQGDYTYDDTATEVVVDVEQGLTENDRVILFTATYDHYGTPQVVEGSFGYTTL